MGSIGRLESCMEEFCDFQGCFGLLRSEVNRAVAKDSFEIGKGEGKRHGLSMAIFNFQGMFLSTHEKSKRQDLPPLDWKFGPPIFIRMDYVG